MYCYKCGSKIPDNAHFCPFCGEILDKEDSLSKPVPVRETTVMESDLKLSLGGFNEYVSSTPYIRKDINLFIENTGTSPKYQIAIQLSGPPQIQISPISKKFRVVGSHLTKRATFQILPKEVGNFTLNATLFYESGQSLVLPINLKVEPSSFAPQESYRTASASSGGNAFLAIAIVFGIVSLMLIGFGIPVAFNSLSAGLTMIVIGIILLAIASQGKCFLCFLGCDSCDGCDCDC